MNPQSGVRSLSLFQLIKPCLINLVCFFPAFDLLGATGSAQWVGKRVNKILAVNLFPAGDNPKKNKYINIVLKNYIIWLL